MVMRNDLVHMLDEKTLEQVVADLNLREVIRKAYWGSERLVPHVYDVTVTTTSEVTINSRFTGTALIQLTNQEWVRSIEPWHDCRMG